MCFPLFPYASATDLSAQLSDSDPPPVKYISSGFAPIDDAIISLAAFTSFLFLDANVYIPDGVTKYPQRMLSGCAKLPSFIIPNTVTSIGAFAMSDCPKLEYINIPDSVTYIDDAAFYNTGIKSATISKNITAIPRLLFSTCKELTNIVYNGTKT